MTIKSFAINCVVAICAAASSVTATPAAAQTSVPKAITIDGNVTVTSDYRFRGISQSNRDPAIQATANVTHRSGIYAGTFVSTIGEYVVDGADPEIDLYAGIRKTIGGTALDGGLLYYIYPGTVTFKGNSFEPYISASHTWGPVTGRLGGNFAWKQRSLGLQPGERRSAIYTYGELAVAVPSTPLTLNSHVGHAFHATYGTFGARYTDWSLGATYSYKRLSANLSYIDTNTTLRSYPGARNDRNVSGAGIASSLGFAF